MQIGADLPVQMHAGLAHVAGVAVVGVVREALPAVRGHLRCGHEARLLGPLRRQTRDQAQPQVAARRGQEPLAADRLPLRRRVRPVAVGMLVADEVVLREAVGLLPERDLDLAGREAARAQPCLAVVAALAGHHIDAAADRMQAVARIIGAAHHLDAVEVQREHHVDEALVAAVDIARDAVDQHLDAVDVALAVEGAEGRLARLGAHAGLGELDARQQTEQFPALRDVAILDAVGPENVDRGQHLAGLQHAAAAAAHGHAAQHDRGIAGSRGTGRRGGVGLGTGRRHQAGQRGGHRQRQDLRGRCSQCISAWCFP